MPADLTREEIERLPGVLAEMESRLHFGGDPEDDRPATEVWSELWFCDADYMLVFKAARLALSEPTRLAAARAEGYREGVEAAIADAVAVSIRDEVDSYEMRDDGGGGYSPTDDERIMLEDFGAGLVAVFEQRLRALSPPPAEPAGGTAEPADWTVSDTELARDILCYLGIGSDASLEPGDRRRDRIAAMICADRERRIVKPATRITALEAENAALREKVAAADRALEPFAGIGAWLFARDLPDAMPLVDILGINGASGVLTRGDFKAAHTARALLQGQGGGDAATV